MLAFDAGAFGFRNLIINGGFNVNQRAYASGAAVGTGLYGHDRWKIAGSADTYTYSTAANVTTVTIPAGKVLQQVVEGTNLQSGTYTLSWTGTAQGKIGAGSYGASGITGTIVGGTNTTIEFGPGTVSNVQLEFGSAATAFEVRHYGLELILCQRYYQAVAYTTPIVAGQIVGASPTAVSTFRYSVIYPTPMRTSPSLTLYSGSTGTANKMYSLGSAADVTPSATASYATNFWCEAATTGNSVDGRFSFGYSLSAEL
jgi:hypothetical protein